MSGRRLFVFGLGYTARVVADGLRAEGWSVAGTSRSPERVEALRDAGFEAYPFDRNHPLKNPAEALGGTTHLLVSIPPENRGDPVLARYAADLARMPTLEWAGYLSTTEVYGDTNGEWITETSWLKPGNDRARRRVEVERGWLDLYRQHGLQMHVFRLAGIYGPGRSAIDDLRAGTARRVDKPGHVFCRIHVEDIAGTLRTSIEHPNPGGVYNVADDLPAPAHEVVAYAAGLLGIEPPPLVPLEQAGLSATAASFYAECRRVKNDRIKNRLGVALKYPDYKAGLAAQLATV